VIDDGRWLAGLALGTLAVARVATDDLVALGSWPRTPDFDPDDTGVPLERGSLGVARSARRVPRAPLGLPRARIGFSPNGVRYVYVEKGPSGDWYTQVSTTAITPGVKWYALFDVRRVGEPEDLLEAVVRIEEEMPRIIESVYGIQLGPDDLIRVNRVRSSGAYGKNRKPLHVQQMAIYLDSFTVGAWKDPLGTGKPRGRTWPPLIGHDHDDPEVIAQSERFEAVAEHLRKLGFGV